MHLNIEQAGAEHVAAAIHHLRALGRFAIIEQPLTKISDSVAVGQQRALGIEPRFGVDQPGVDVGDALASVFAGGFLEGAHMVPLYSVIASVAKQSSVERLRDNNFFIAKDLDCFGLKREGLAMTLVGGFGELGHIT